MRSKVSAFKKLLLFFAAATLSALVLFVYLRNFAVPRSIRSEAEKYSRIYSVDEKLVLAVIKVESGFEKDRVSLKGACGLMQILPSTFDYVKNKTSVPEGGIFDVGSNVCAGCYYLDYLEKKFLFERETLCAYNAGEGTVRSWLKDERYSSDGKTLNVIPYKETEKYVEKVMFYYDFYKVIL